MIDTLLQDVRYAARSLRRRPMVTTIAVLSLALGIGVNSALFSIFNRLLLQPLPVPSAGELVVITSPGPRPGNTSTGDAGRPHTVFTAPLFRDLERIQTPFTAIGGFREIAANLSFHGETQSGDGLLVSGGYFDALRLRPALGRLLTVEDDREGRSNEAVVLSHRRMVLLQTSRIAVTASALGVALAIGMARLAESMLYGITPLDPRVQGGAALLMLAIAFMAAVLPARRAAGVDPVHALRAE